MAVSVVKCGGAAYPDEPPFHPSESYPESPFPEISDRSNRVYDSVRNLLNLSDFDAANFDKPGWNPFGDLIKPGMTVLVKPNMIKENHPRDPHGWIYMMTHGSIVRAVCDYAVKAVGETGRVYIGDAPQTDSSFSRIADILQLRTVADFYRQRGFDVRLVDFRKYEWKSVNDVVVSRKDLLGDPNGFVTFNLGRDSLFYGHRGEGRYYGADYATDEINAHHCGERHEYVIAGTAIKADMFINLPKLKTHKKAGVTLSLKNLVGINGDKNYLPHYTMGTPSEGGDQFPSGPGYHSTHLCC